MYRLRLLWITLSWFCYSRCLLLLLFLRVLLLLLSCCCQLYCHFIVHIIVVGIFPSTIPWSKSRPLVQLSGRRKRRKQQSKEAKLYDTLTHTWYQGMIFLLTFSTCLQPKRGLLYLLPFLYPRCAYVQAVGVMSTLCTYFEVYTRCGCTINSNNQPSKKLRLIFGGGAT